MTQYTAKNAGELLADKMDDAHSGASAALDKGTKRVQAVGRQGLDAMSDMAGQACDAVSTASDSIVAYTKKNPAKALAIAAASGALLYAALKVLTPSRD